MRNSLCAKYGWSNNKHVWPGHCHSRPANIFQTAAQMLCEYFDMPEAAFNCTSVQVELSDIETDTCVLPTRYCRYFVKAHIVEPLDSVPGLAEDLGLEDAGFIVENHKGQMLRYEWWEPEECEDLPGGVPHRDHAFLPSWSSVNLKDQDFLPVLPWTKELVEEVLLSYQVDVDRLRRESGTKFVGVSMQEIAEKLACVEWTLVRDLHSIGLVRLADNKTFFFQRTQAS
eukprot:gnl/MRDRNA2_/MRDRNA2_81852_c0_seq1.p2 gnl/MRDRNA2_/MRDRNA2_81852_c0~~gnl/MRDRNA2_/MRDRNA2_81852_c0_seq1.p2  ORF type:complete len:228 (+),score=39.00 gnl/MRDRNA2_/MRDRNA2_81852_c0_seq1:982-1665(+)